MATAGTHFSLLLLGRFAGKDKPVAAALARDFGCDETWGMQVLGAAPIILLDGLSSEQAQAIREALADVEMAGSRIEIRPGTDPDLPRVGWAASARIKGRPLSDYAGGSTATATLFLPCPYTGQKIKLSISVNVERVVEPPAVGTAAALPPVPIPVPAPPIPVPVPSPSLTRSPSGIRSALAANRRTPAPSGSAALPLPRPQVLDQTFAPHAPPAPAGEPAIQGLDALDELHPKSGPTQPAGGHAPSPTSLPPGSPARGVAEIQISVPVAMPQPLPVPPTSSAERPDQAGLPARGSAPLPDIPVLQGPPAPAPAMPEAPPNPEQATMPNDLLSTPMDLSAFEANVTASGILKPFSQQAASQPAAPPAAASQQGAPEASASPSAGAATLAADDGAVWSVIMGKSGNPKVHQAVAELQGIPVADAAQLCQRPFVALAKDVSGVQARNLKQQFAALNVHVRLTKRG